LTAQPYLVADIGATNARFALADSAQLTTDVATLVTADFASAETLIAAAREALNFDAIEGCCIAMAGPVTHGRGTITNGALKLDAEDLSARLNCPSAVINDFAAVAHALPRLKKLRQIGGDDAAPGVKALLGPGSGLGMSALLPARRKDDIPMVLASEGGHADLAPGSPLEMEVLQILGGQLPHVSWESVLSGPGLVNLYVALCAVWGAKPEPVSPEWISANGVNADEPLCHQVLELFFGFLGSAAGNFALTLCAQGGVYIGGGIVPAIVRANAKFPAASPLRRRFEERGVLADYAARIPLYIILDENPGLLGSLACLGGWRLIHDSDKTRTRLGQDEDLAQI
jgi:glucokinase